MSMPNDYRASSRVDGLLTGRGVALPMLSFISIFS